MDASGARGARRLAARRIRLILFVALLLASAMLVVAPRPSPGTVAAAATGDAPPALYRQGVVVAAGPTSYDSLQAMNPSVLVESGTFRMWYGGCDPSYVCSIILATSSDGVHWTKDGVVLSPTGGAQAIVGWPSVVHVGGTYWMYYGGTDTVHTEIFAATSTDGMTWTRQGMVLSYGVTGSADATGVFAPHILVAGTTYRMWYTGVGASGISSILLATSTNGLNWTKQGLVLAPGPAGSLDSYSTQYSSVVQNGSAYVMVYSGLTTASAATLLYATSSDGVTWQKNGQLLAGIPGNETNLFQPDLVVLANGQWDLYYAVRNGVNDLAIHLASSASSGSPAPSPGPQPSELAEWIVAAATGMGAAGGVGIEAAVNALTRGRRRA